MIFQTALHPVSLAGGAIGALFTLFVAGVIVWNNALAGADMVRALGWGVAISGLWLVGPVLRYRRSDVRIEGEAMVVQAGIVGGPKRASLADIKDVATHQTALGEQLGFGTIAVVGAENTGATLRHVRDAAGLRDAIIRQRKQSRRSVQRTGR